VTKKNQDTGKKEAPNQFRSQRGKRNKRVKETYNFKVRKKETIYNLFLG